MRKLLAVIAVWAIAFSVIAQTENQYIGPASGAIDTPANWSLGYIPTNSAEIGVIGSGDSVQTVSGTTYSNYYLRVDTGASWSGSGLGGGQMRDGELTLNGGTIQPFRGIDAYGSAYWNFISGTFNMSDSDLELYDTVVLDMNGATISPNSSKGLVFRNSTAVINMNSGNIGTSTNTSGDIDYLGGNAFFGGVGGTFNMYGGDVYANKLRAGRSGDMTFVIHGTSGSMFGRSFNYPLTGRVIMDFRSGSTIPVTVASTGWAETLWDAGELKFDSMDKTALGGLSWASVTTNGGLGDYYFVDGGTSVSLAESSSVFTRAFVVGGKAVLVGSKAIIPAPEAWTPADMTVSAWYDASDLDTITESSGSVSQWDDKSGTTNVAYQSTGQYQPDIFTKSMDYKNVLAGNSFAEDAYMEVTGSVTVQCVFAVVDVSGGGTASTIISLGAEDVSGGTTPELFVRDDSPQLSFDAGGDNTGRSAVNGDDWTIFYYENIVDDDVSAGACVVAMLSTNSFPLNAMIGRDDVTVGPNSNHKLSELIWLDSEPDTATKQRLEGYLAWKWGLEGNLPSDHPYKTQKPVK